MSIRSRVSDAEALWKSHRKQEALLAALSAANDTARKRFPQARDAKESLSQFIAAVVDQLGAGVDAFDWTFRGGVSLGEVLYGVYRSLLDASKLPPDVELVPESEFRVHLLDGNRRGYSDCLALRLIDAVKRAPENAEEFARHK